MNGKSQVHFFQSKYLSACHDGKAVCELLLSFLCVQFSSECL